MGEATVVKSTGSWYLLKTRSGEKIQARIKGKFRLQGQILTNPVAVGDQVSFELEDSGDETFASIKNIHPRRNYVVRQSPRKKHQLHLMASNIDQALLIVTIVQPKLKQGFIDRFLLMTEPYNIPVTVAFNKSDLFHEEERDIFHYLKAVYENIGYDVILCSCETGEGLADIKESLASKITLISGQSGVGKSSLINLLIPDLNIKTEELSEYTGKGQHTTTFAEMFELENGVFIIDTPGIKTLSFNNLEPMDVAHNFREIFKLSEDCKYSDCTHRQEPNCAVKHALEEGYISELRYANYLQILEEVEDQNYWERHKDV